MLGKLVRAVFTIVGAIVGYGLYLLVKYWAGLKGYDLETEFTVVENIFIAAVIALIFAIIFYKLFPLFRRGGMKAAGNLESDLRDTPLNDILSAIAGLIMGLFVAYLGLTGDLRAVQNCDKIIKEAQRLGFARVVLPIKNAQHLREKDRQSFSIEIVGLRNITEAKELFPRTYQV